MVDIYLYNSLHGELVPNKIVKPPAIENASDKRFKTALENSVEEQVDLLMKETDPAHYALNPWQIRRAKLKNELLESIDLKELSSHHSAAIRILKNEGKSYLNDEENQALLIALDQMRDQLEKLDLRSLDDSSFRKALAISEDVHSLILGMGITAFTRELFSDSLSIFAFLSLIDPENPEYWYRLGLAAQQLEQYKLAIQAYAATANLAPEFIGVHIFSAQCYLKTGQRSAAQVEFAAAKEIEKKVGVEKDWASGLKDIENLIA